MYGDIRHRQHRQSTWLACVICVPLFCPICLIALWHYALLRK